MTSPPKLLLPFLMVLLSSPALSHPPSIETLQERCTKKTRVHYIDKDEGELVLKGERVDGYCAGFLEGVLAALEHEKLACPKWEKERISTEFLLSVLDNYEKENSQEDAKASVVVVQAFKRAFSCED